MSNGAQRLITGILVLGVALAAVFWLPDWLFLGLTLGLVCWAAWEYVEIVRIWAPSAPLRCLLPLTVALALALVLVLQPGFTLALPAWTLALALGSALVLTAAGVVLGSRTAMRDASAGLGLLAFGIPYFALPAVSLYVLKRLDPSLLLLLLVVVALGDTLAYYVGSAIGRHRLAPVVSPKKSWEGAVASFLGSLAAAALWSSWQLGVLHPGVLGVVAVTAVAAQIGDLSESLIKRGAGVKDSSNVLPGHGGVLDRLDAILFAAPVFVTGWWLLGLDALFSGAPH